MTELWLPEAHVPAHDGLRRTMHGVEVNRCGMNRQLDQYDPLANHGPHRGATTWCPGYATQRSACATAPDSVDAGADHTHGAHAWRRDDSDLWLWCAGYRNTAPLPDRESGPVWSKWDEGDRRAGWLEPGDGLVALWNGRPA